MLEIFLASHIRKQEVQFDRCMNTYTECSRYIENLADDKLVAEGFPFFDGTGSKGYGILNLWFLGGTLLIAIVISSLRMWLPARLIASEEWIDAGMWDMGEDNIGFHEKTLSLSVVKLHLPFP